MIECFQNLLILFLIIVLIYSITRCFKNKQIKEVNDVSNMIRINLPAITPTINDLNNNAIISYQEDTPTDIKETTIIYPINNNVLNNDINEEDLSNNNEFVPNQNLTIVEENNENNNNSFNYSKEFSNEFQGFDPTEIYPAI